MVLIPWPEYSHTDRVALAVVIPAWIGNKTVMADLIHQMTAGGCSPEGQCTYVHFLFTWPTKEVFTGLA